MEILTGSGGFQAAVKNKFNKLGRLGSRPSQLLFACRA